VGQVGAGNQKLFTLASHDPKSQSGQVGAGNQKLFTRLKQHTRDSLAGRWNKFSWFGIRWVKKNNELANEADGKHSTHAEVLNHIEAILIHAAEPKQNRQGGRFGEDVV